ncbi:MAG: hypothetical protein ABII12_15070 [Planctomycetota bacterium]
MRIAVVVAVGVCLLGSLGAGFASAAPAFSQESGSGLQLGSPEDPAEVTSRACEAENTTSRPCGGLPEIAYEDLALLVQTARRAFWETATDAVARRKPYRPPALRGKSGIIHLTLRRHGAALAESESEVAGLVDAAIAAGTLLGQAVREKKIESRQGWDELGIEFELLGPPEYIEGTYTSDKRWSESLLHAFEPAAEGIGVEFRGRCGWTRPSEVVTFNYSPDLAIQAAESAIQLKHADKLMHSHEIRYYRFGAYHLWQPAARSLPIRLFRGSTLVPLESAGPEVLDAAIKRMGEYLHYRQNRDGWFSEEFRPSRDRYSAGNSAVVQMHAALGLAAYASWSGDARVAADVKKGTAKSACFLKPLSVVTSVSESGEPQVKEAGLALIFEGHGDSLEISSQFLLTLLSMLPVWNAEADIWPELSSTTQGATSTAPAVVASRPASLTVRDSLTGLAGMLASCQTDDGRIIMRLETQRPGEQAGQEDVRAAGWALLALARADAWFAEHPTAGEAPRPAGLILHRALAQYGPRCESSVGPGAATMLARAFAASYQTTREPAMSDLVFSILDRLAQLQVDEHVCPWPELYGAINARERGLIGIDTALYLTAMADGLMLAERIGDAERAARYRKVVRSAVRFVLQLEFREPACFYIRTPRDVLGGVRKAPWDNRVRADHCAAALMSLIRARQAIYGGPKSVSP